MTTRAGALTPPRSSFTGFHVAIWRVLAMGPCGSGPRQIHEDATFLSRLGARFVQRTDHPAPLALVFVGAIDPQNVHTCAEQPDHPRGIRLVRPGRRDHNGDVAAVGPRTEDLARVLVQECVGCFPRKGGGAHLFEARKLSAGGRDARQRERFVRARRYLQQIAHDAALGPAQRREASLGELTLKVAQIVLPERDVVDQVPRARAPVQGHASERRTHLLLESHEPTFQTNQRPGQRAQGHVSRTFVHGASLSDRMPLSSAILGDHTRQCPSRNPLDSEA